MDLFNELRSPHVKKLWNQKLQSGPQVLGKHWKGTYGKFASTFILLNSITCVLEQSIAHLDGRPSPANTKIDLRFNTCPDKIL
jgi:hypothetical protein